MNYLELIRKICIISAIAWLLFMVTPEFWNEIERQGLFGLDTPVYFIILLVYAGPFIAINIIFDYIEPKVESQIEDVQHSQSVKDKNYLIAYSEVEENKIKNKELWAKAFAQCDGDKERQKSIYVELRTKELSKR